jgi:acetylornithine deacetylase/succinyl-diaminopimelate desuccinylase-like protein
VAHLDLGDLGRRLVRASPSPTNGLTNAMTPKTAAPQVSNDIDAWFTREDRRIRAELDDFLKIPSVSARSEHAGDMRRCADWLAERIRVAGMTATVHSTPGHPIVVGEWRGAGPKAPTVLVYGHYDVQPVEPLDLWTSPPFEPTVRDGKLYARGSVDDKGQLYVHVKAAEALLKVRGKLPVNLIILAEGEEEVGSDNLAAFVRKNVKLLACDSVIISDSAMFAPGQPSILSSLRGIQYWQVDVVGPSVDLHSGSYGGAVVNPATALARIVASFHDAKGRVAIKGFYNKVRAWDKKSRAAIKKLKFSDKHFRDETGASDLGGESGFSTLERIWSRPTCEVNGVLSGYTGEGAKTVLPSKSMAKVSCRLVPDQDPHEVDKLFRAHIKRVSPKGVTVNVTTIHGGYPWRAELKGPLYDAARRALEAAFNKAPVIVGEGGSIPVVGDFADILKAPVLLVGFGLPGENAHAPDEWISVENFTKGLRAIATLYEELG